MSYADAVAVARARILLAEDNPDMRAVFHDCLDANYTVVAVENGDQLEKEILEGDFDVIISDIVMDGKNCQEIYREHIRNRRPIPFIMISGLLPPADQPKTIGNENDNLYLLTKPFRLQTLCDLVECALARR
jgi:CheY-like chemotaxis protein